VFTRGERFPESKDYNPGPGAYELQKLNEKSWKSKPVTRFSSSQKRSHFDETQHDSPGPNYNPSYHYTTNHLRI